MTASAENQTRPQNRLSIAHLMLWTLGTAIALGLYRLSGHNEQLEASGARWRVYALIYCLLAGPKIGGLFLFAGRLVSRRQEVPLQPGHWLLWIEGLSTLLVYSGQVIANRFLGENLNVSVWAASQLPNCGITAFAYALALAWQPAVSSLWKFTFVVLLLQHAAAGLMNLLLALWHLTAVGIDFSLLGPQVCCLHYGLFVPLTLAAVIDPDRQRRDYLHWAGVATVAGTEIAFLSAGMIF